MRQVKNLRVALVAALFALSLSLLSQDRVLFSVDFTSGLGECQLSEGVTVGELPLGGNYVQCTLPKSEGMASVTLPEIPFAGAEAVEVKVKYRSTMGGGEHYGAWVYMTVTDGAKTLATPFILCTATKTWKEGVVRFPCPPGAKSLNVQLRLQAATGSLDWRGVTVSAIPPAALQEPKTDKPAEDKSLAVLTTFKLEKGADGYILTDGKTVLKNQNPAAELPYIFTLPDEWCENPGYTYEVQVDLTTTWGTASQGGFRTFFALGQNVMGYDKNSATLTFLEGRLLARIIGEAFGNTAGVQEPLTVAAGKAYSIRSRFSATDLEMSLDGNLLGRTGMERKFFWPKGKPFMVGAEAKGLSVLNGEIKSFTLRVLEESIQAAFVGSDFGYYIGAPPHSFVLTFPREDGDSHETTVTVKDINGKAMATLTPVQKTPGSHAFTLPALPFGSYALSARVAKGDAARTIERSIAIMPRAARRESAERSSFGVTQEWPLSREEFNPVMTEESFAKMEAMGMRWFRLWVSWCDIEEERGKYYFDSLDTVVAQAQKHGISIMPTLIGGHKQPFQSIRPADPKTARLAGPMYALPSDMSIWLEYVTALATRYKGAFKHYQIWNETDTKWYIYPFSAEAYLDILSQSAAAIRAVDPEAVIHLAGFCAAYEPGHINRATHTPDDKVIGLAEFYNLKPQAHFDVSDYHFYCVNQPGQSFDGYVPIVENLKQFLAERGDGAKPMWDSETGLLSTSDPERVGKSGGLFNVPLLSEREHAIRIVTRQVQELSLGVAVVLNYRFHGNGGFELVRADYSPKPVFPAMVNLTNMLYGKDFEKQIMRQNANLRGYTFTDAGSALTILWTMAGQEILTVCPEKDAEVFMTDMMGNRQPAPPSIMATEEPIYLESKDPILINGLIGMTLPDVIAENEPYDVSLAITNPFPDPMQITVAATIGNAVLARREIVVPGKSQQTETMSVTAQGSPLVVQGVIRGALSQEFLIEQKVVARKAVAISPGGEAAFEIASPQQVKVGGKTMDGQGRVVAEGQWQGAADLSAKGTLAVSGRNVAFSLQIMDNEIVPVETTLYNGDAVELFIDMRAPAERQGMDGVYQVIVGANGKIWARNNVPEGFTANASAVAGGWQLTGCFTLSPNVTDRFGFDVSIDDADDSNGRKAQMVWAGSADNHRDATGYGIVIINNGNEEK